MFEGCSCLVGWGAQVVGFLIGFCFFVRSSVVFWCWYLLSLVCSLRVLWGLAWSSWRAAIFRDVGSYFHRQLFLMEYLFAHVPPFLGLWCGFRCGCAADMSKVTDGGLLALAGAGVGPGLEHLEFFGESAYFEFNSWCFSLVVALPPLSSSALIVLLIFWVHVLVSNWVGSYQGAVLPESVFFCLYASVLTVRLGSVAG